MTYAMLWPLLKGQRHLSRAPCRVEQYRLSQSLHFAVGAPICPTCRPTVLGSRHASSCVAVITPTGSSECSIALLIFNRYATCSCLQKPVSSAGLQKIGHRNRLPKSARPARRG